MGPVYEFAIVENLRLLRVPETLQNYCTFHQNEKLTVPVSITGY